MLPLPPHYHTDIPYDSATAECFQHFLNCLILKFISPVCMEQTYVLQASFRVLKCFFYKLRRFMLPRTVTCDFSIKQIHKHADIIPLCPGPHIRQVACHDIPVSLSLKLPVQDICSLWFINCCGPPEIFPLFRDQPGLVRLLFCFVIISASIYLQDATHCWYRVFAGICLDYICFRPKISAACFKMSFSIFNCCSYLRRWMSSSCSGVRLSFSWKDPEFAACFTHLSNREWEISYSLQISHLRLPERYKSTNCCLNSL